MAQKDRKFPAIKFHGNDETMNLNPMLWTNIVSSHYFKKELIHLKDFNAIVDEIYYKVTHLDPWEKGSNIMSAKFKVYRGVSGLGVVSTAFCLLYKLHKLRLTHKQLVKLIKHPDSPYIRAIGFLYIRYTQPPENLWGWYKEFIFDDKDKFSLKPDGERPVTIREMLHSLLLDLHWFSALLPRIPVSLMKEFRQKLVQEPSAKRSVRSQPTPESAKHTKNPAAEYDNKSKFYQDNSRSEHRHHHHSCSKNSNRKRKRSKHSACSSHHSDHDHDRSSKRKRH